jgi:hypothetical protein
MKYCPLMSFAKQYSQEQHCLGEECAMAADGAGECLIRQALQLYVSQERTKIAEKANAMQYFETIAKNGKRVPISFIEESE